MALLYLNRTTHVFTIKGAKHAGKTMEQVAEEDPGYLIWIYQKGTKDLDDQSFYALEDILKKKGVDVATLI